MRRALVVALLPLVLALASCPGAGGAAKGAGRTIKKSHEQLMTAFARAVVAKDYDAAFGCTSASYQRDVGRSNFLESIRRFREGVEDGKAVRFGLGTAEEDPAALKDDTMVKLLVGDEKERASIVEEVIVEFSVSQEEGWTLVAWIVEEGGASKILNYYQDD
jgi:hypothetical protein